MHEKKANNRLAISKKGFAVVREPRRQIGANKNKEQLCSCAVDNLDKRALVHSEATDPASKKFTIERF